MSLSNAPRAPRLIRIALALALAGLTAGCFQPLYGDHSIGATAGVSDKLGSVEVPPIDTPNGTRVARVGVEMRNKLLFDLTGGGAGQTSAYKLVVRMSPTQTQVIVDINSARPEIQNYGINATYVLYENASGKEILRGETFARVSYNIPGQQQRFAGDRGLRDAENRAANVIADNLHARLVAYFAAGA